MSCELPRSILVMFRRDHPPDKPVHEGLDQVLPILRGDEQSFFVKQKLKPRDFGILFRDPYRVNYGRLTPFKNGLAVEESEKLGCIMATMEGYVRL